MSKDIDFQIIRDNRHVCTVTYHDNKSLYDYLQARGKKSLCCEALCDMERKNFDNNLVNRKLVPVLMQYIKNGYSVTINFV